MTYTKNQIIQSYWNQILVNDRKTIDALLKIYNNQTDSEKFCEETLIKNNIGFNSVDSKFLTSCAKWVLSGKSLSPKQMAIVKNKLKKYCGQLLSISISNGLIEKTGRNKYSVTVR